VRESASDCVTVPYKIQDGRKINKEDRKEASVAGTGPGAPRIP
jgi:hypothetical protein